MADLQYTVGVQTSGAITALNTLQGKISGLTSSFSKLQGVMAGLAIGAMVTNVLNFADSMNDLRDATGVATQTILGFNQAVLLNGGDAETASTGLLRLVNSIGEAADGGVAAQYAFSQVGVSLDNLRKLSEEDILKKVVSGLAGISNASTRAVISAQLLGKSFQSVNLVGVNDNFASATAGARNFATSVEKADQIQKKLDAGMNTLRASLLKVLEPLANFVGNLKQEQVDKFVDAVVKLGAAAVSLVAFGKAFGLISSLVASTAAAFALFKSGIFTFTASIATAGVGIASLQTTLGRLWLQFTKYVPTAYFKAWANGTSIMKEVAITVSVLGTRLTFLVRGLLAIGVGAAGMALGLARMIPYIGILVTALTALQYAIKFAFDFDVIDWFIKRVGKAYDKFKEFLGLKSGVTSDPQRTTLADTGAGGGRGGNAATTAEQIRHGEEMRKQAEEEALARRKVVDAFAKQKIAIGEVSKAFAKNSNEVFDSILLQNSLIGKSKEYVDVVTAQEASYKKTIDAIDQLTLARSKLSKEELQAGLGKTYDDQIAKVKELGAIEEKRLKSAIENTNRLESLEQLRLYGIQQQIDLQNKIKDVQDNIAKSTMTALEQKYYDIEQAAKASAKAAIEAEEARIGRTLNTEEVAAYYKAALEGAQKLRDVTKEEYDNSRKFSTGWQQAFNDYVENATNAANQAKRAFENVTKGMEDLIINFAKTGKFAFKDFISSVVEMMMRNDIQKLMAGMFSSKGNGSGGNDLFSGIGKLLGFANGGMIPTNGPVLVGERGPELLSGAAGRTVTPNNALGTVVTYNINAVDARSFQQLLAQQPELLYALTQKGSPRGGR